MPTLLRPSIVLPQYVVTQEDMIRTLQGLFPEHPDWRRAKAMIQNTQVHSRYSIRPLEECVAASGFESRSLIYGQEARRLGAIATREALAFAEMRAQDIDLIIVVSCTGFMMPSLTAFLINEFPFSSRTKQLPIAQLGCAAGAAAINRAFEYCKAFPEANVLIVSAEFSSLCYQPAANTLSDMICSALFGDAVTACVMRGGAGSLGGYQITDAESFLLKNTERYIAYDIKDSGFHFVLDKEVIGAVRKVAPVMKSFVAWSSNREVSDLEFFVFHTGGRRILDELVNHLGLNEDAVSLSRQSLRECGNVASAVVFDVLARVFEKGDLANGSRGMLAAFGPGFTSEMNVGVWTH
jgi:type III polyketide synthase